MCIGRASQENTFFPAINTLTFLESWEVGPSLSWNLVVSISNDKNGYLRYSKCKWNKS